MTVQQFSWIAEKTCMNVNASFPRFLNVIWANPLVFNLCTMLDAIRRTAALLTKLPFDSINIQKSVHLSCIYDIQHFQKRHFAGWLTSNLSKKHIGTRQVCAFIDMTFSYLQWLFCYEAIQHLSNAYSAIQQFWSFAERHWKILNTQVARSSGILRCAIKEGRACSPQPLTLPPIIRGLGTC
jgi:hypothetical protein